MWSTATRKMSFTGNVQVARTGYSSEPLVGVAVDVYRFHFDEFGEWQFAQLNELPVITDSTGGFEFNDLPVSVQVRLVTSGTPPYGTVEIVEPNSLPCLAFRVSAVSGSQFVEIYDERTVVDGDWVSLHHPERKYVPLTGSPPLEVLIPDIVPASTALGNEFHFLRIGRATRDEIGEVGVSQVGLMNSATPSFFPGIVDAPFGSMLQIGGHFGPNFLTPPLSDELYYTVSYWEYGGDPTLPFNPALLTNEVQILDPLFNKRYVLPTSPTDKGYWDNRNFGPFNGTVTATGTPVQVYKRPGLYDFAVEYWPYWDLMVIWDSTAVPDGLVILTLEVYRKIGGTDTNPDLQKLTIASSAAGNEYLPLQINNCRPVPTLFDWRTAFATFSPAEAVGSVAAFDPCGVMPVTPNQVDSNECILVKYSVEDGDGNAHPYLKHYGLWVEFTPRQVAGAPLSSRVTLKGQGSDPANPPFGLGLGYKDINGSYHTGLSTAPLYSVQNYESVLVPRDDDGWPPEPMGDPPSPCAQYAVEVSLGCSVRTVNGWSRLFGHRHISRHIIVTRT
jgi:hypothetical protein